MVTNRRTLKAMARQGFIKLPKETVARHWSGLEVPVCYVEEGPKLAVWYDTFCYRGTFYRLRYVEGCFFPFVFRANEEPPAFV